MTRGRFITLEGLDGAGKSTQGAWLEGHLRGRGIAVVVTREPGGTALGEALRELMLRPASKLHAETEALLMFAARREHVDKVIQPALASGCWVLCDRFTDATFAYQCGGSGVAWDKVAGLERWVHHDLQPDLTLFFDVPPAVGLARAKRIKEPDRFESEAVAFYLRVRDAYLRRAAESPQRVRIIDATRPMTDIQNELERIVSTL